MTPEGFEPPAFGFGIQRAAVAPWSLPHTLILHHTLPLILSAALAQLGERQTEDLKVPGSIPGGGIFTLACVTGKPLWPNG